MCKTTVKNDRSRRKVEKIENKVRCCVKREEAADGRAAARLTCEEKVSIEDDGKRRWLLKIREKEEFLPLFGTCLFSLCIRKCGEN